MPVSGDITDSNYWHLKVVWIMMIYTTQLGSQNAVLKTGKLTFLNIFEKYVGQLVKMKQRQHHHPKNV